MERFVVTLTKEGLWSVSYDGETFATYAAEEEALLTTLARAAERRRAGTRVLVIVTRGQNEADGKKASLRPSIP